jgi:hypothetical protein
LAFLKRQRIAVLLVVAAVAAGVRFAGLEWAFVNSPQADNPATGVPATAKERFGISTGSVLRDARNPTPSKLDCLFNRAGATIVLFDVGVPPHEGR